MSERPLPPDVVVRRAGVRDADALGAMRAAMHAELRGRSGAATDPEIARYAKDCSAFFARELGSDAPRTFAWVAESDGDAVGSAALSVAPGFPRLDTEGVRPEGRVRSVYVVPRLRGRGVATRMLMAVIREAELLGVARLTLGASPLGRPLYEALGFVGKLDEMTYEFRRSGA